MSEWIQAAKTKDIPDGSMKEVTLKGKGILLARVGGKFYAADNKCPHFGAKLSEGKLEGVAVTCPKHKSEFDLTDGHVIKWTNFPSPIKAMTKLIKREKSLTIHAVKVEGDSIFIDI